MLLNLGRGLSPTYCATKTFTPTDLSALALWIDATDASTITQSSGAVSQTDDKSGEGTNLTQTIAAEQPIYDLSSKITFDLSDDNLEFTVPAGGWAGTMVFGFKQGSYAVEVSYDAGTQSIGPYLPDNELVGIALYDRALTEREKTQLIDFMVSKGAGGIDGWSTITSASSAWRSNNITSFPAIDMPLCTNFANAWNSNDLSLFPNIDLSAGNLFVKAWNGNCLTTFPPNMFDELTFAGTNCFQLAWNGNNIDASGMENILVSIDTGGAPAPSSGSTGIDITSNGDSLTAATTTAIASLKVKGWAITIDGVIQ